MPVTLRQVGDVILVEVFIEGRTQQLLRKVGQNGRRPGRWGQVRATKNKAMKEGKKCVIKMGEKTGG